MKTVLAATLLLLTSAMHAQGILKTNNGPAEILYEKTEVLPSVERNAWRNHLEKNLLRYIDSAADRGMPDTMVKVQVRFIVERDGSLSEVEAMNDPGYGLARAAVSVLVSGPRWTPGTMNGRAVRTRFVQPIAFVLLSDAAPPTESKGMPPVEEDKNLHIITTRPLETESLPKVDAMEWRKHLERQLPRYIDKAAAEGMKPGVYTVVVRFRVDADEQITEAAIEGKDPGYGLGAGALELVQRGPKWKPARKNGQPVAAWQTQPVSFMIAE